MSRDDRPHNATVLACHLPKVDPSGRAVAPLAIVVLVAFALLWGSISGPTVVASWRLDQGRLVQASETTDGKLEFVDANGGVRTTEPPNAWLQDRATDGTVALRVPIGDDLAPALASGTRTQLVLVACLFLVAPGMLYGAWRLVLLLRADKAQRARLKSSATRVRARAVRIVEERVGGRRTRRTEYRVMATFEAGDGKRYEAASDLFPSGEPPEVGVDGLDVLYDRAQPLESMVDEASPAMRTARSARPRAGRPATRRA